MTGGSMTYYQEAFIEDPTLGCRWRVFNNGEGMIEFQYQEWKDGNWVSDKFIGLPASEADAICRAIQSVKDFPDC